MFAGDDKGGDPQELTIAEEFWLMMGRNDRTLAEQIAVWLDIPPVVLSAFSFEMVKEDEGEEAVDLGACHQVEESGALTPRGVTVMPDAPTEAVNAWNRETLVTLLLVTKDEICGAQVGDGEVDFLAYVKKLDWVGGSSCGMTTHQTGGKDPKKQSVLKMTLPYQGGGLLFQWRPPTVLSSAPRCFLVLSSLKQAFPTTCSTRGGMQCCLPFACRRGSGSFLLKPIQERYG
jgi:hypothetical protein